jgi:hypothetical protein
MAVMLQHGFIPLLNLHRKGGNRILTLCEFNSIPGTLQDAGATSNTTVGIVENRHSLFEIRRPAPNRADIVTLPHAGAFLRVKMNLQPAQFASKFQLFL